MIPDLLIIIILITSCFGPFALFFIVAMLYAPMKTKQGDSKNTIKLSDQKEIK